MGPGPGAAVPVPRPLPERSAAALAFNFSSLTHNDHLDLATLFPLASDCPTADLGTALKLHKFGRT